MPFVAMKIAETATHGPEALSLTVPFDELEVLQGFKSYFEKVRRYGAAQKSTGAAIVNAPMWTGLTLGLFFFF